MKGTLAIVHTTPVTVDSLKQLANEYLPGYNVINFVDDSILPQLGRNGGKVEEVEERLIQYYKNAEEVGADLILNACSSVGEVVAKGRTQLNIPIVRIDEAMAEKAIESGTKIGVVATLSTTLNPTLKLIKDKAAEMGKEIVIESALADAAYQKLMSGDPEAHDEILAKVLSELGQNTDIVVLAQASMARAVGKLPLEEQGKFLTSPKLGMERVKDTAKGIVQNETIRN